MANSLTWGIFILLSNGHFQTDGVWWMLQIVLFRIFEVLKLIRPCHNNLFWMNLYFELRWSGDEFHANDSNQLFNLNFYCVENETVYLRTFERGSNETNACGTGATATGGLYLIQKYIKQQQSPKKCCPPIVVRMRGGRLKIDLKQISNQLLGSGLFHATNFRFISGALPD